MTLMWEPIRVFGPPAAVVGLVGMAKLVFDIVDKDFRIATNTLIVLGIAVALGLLGMIADLLVQLNRRSHDVTPASWQL
jgi:hypothetical protein